ncbi:chaplin [Kitasatospora sp. NPDC101235]|uniref:chaplin n=1 Tax=Kitasatospora sp. NPDC101235 TaxID=3364101 RepID=UPI00381C2364
MRMRTTLAATVLTAAAVLAGTGTAVADVTANGVAANSPGFLSGNQFLIPINAQTNVCGNVIGVVAIANQASSGPCINVN